MKTSSSLTLALCTCAALLSGCSKNNDVPPSECYEMIDLVEQKMESLQGLLSPEMKRRKASINLYEKMESEWEIMTNSERETTARKCKQAVEEVTN